MPFNTSPGQIYSQSVQRETLNAGLQHLDSVVAYLSERDRSFAQSLIAQGLERGSLSEKQHYWVGELTSRGLKAHAAYVAQLPTSTPAAAPGNPGHRAVTFPALVKLFTSGSTRPVLFRTKAARNIRLALAGERSAYPGQINVTDDGADYNSRIWYGRITQQGGWMPSRRNDPADQADVEAALAEFNADPAAAARAYGKETHHCCFCGIALTDPRSKAAGYGPICAENRGLAWGHNPEKLSCQEVNAERRQQVSEADIPF